MGFSVTAAHAIFFVAGLTAAAAALDVVWHSSSTTTEARVVHDRAAESAVRTTIVILSTNCPGGTCNPGEALTVEFENTGTTVVDMRNLTFIVEGRVHTGSNFTDIDVTQPAAIGTTDLLLPAETGEIDIANAVLTTLDDDTLNIQVVTLDGVVGRR